MTKKRRYYPGKAPINDEKPTRIIRDPRDTSRDYWLPMWQATALYYANVLEINRAAGASTWNFIETRST